LESNWSGLQKSGVQLQAAQAVGLGFEWGVNLSSHAASEKLFENRQTDAILQGGGMIRLLQDLTESWYAGAQFEMSYAHSLSASESGRYGEIQVTARAPAAVLLGKSMAFGFAPSVLFGEKDDDDISKNRIWGKKFGLSISLWFLYQIDLTTVFLEVEPQIGNWATLNESFRTRVSAGLAFDL